MSQKKSGVESHTITIVGAGISGISTAIKLRQKGITDFIILERSDGPGGTWHNCRYPGLSCDIASHLFCFSFEQKSDWSRTHAYQEEIRAYIASIVEKYDIGSHIRYGIDIQTARWNEPESHWILETKDGSTFASPFFVSAIGMYNQVQWPSIEGLDTFHGPKLHSARWPDQVDFKGKRVGVIGSAASAVQMIPEIAKAAAKLDVFQRTANWVFPKGDRSFSTGELRQFRENPEIGLKLREELRSFYELLLPLDNEELLKQAETDGLANLQNVIDPEVREKMRPRVPAGSQRPLFSDDYYPTFNRPNVELITETIVRITPEGIRTADGKQRDVDMLVFATGYAANKFLSVMNVEGRKGLKLADAWRDGPEAYKGMTTSGFPNLFMLYGPNTNNGSLFFMLEKQADYIAEKLAYIRDNNITSLEVRREVMDQYNDDLQRDISAVKVWRVEATRYYRADSGRIVTQWPHTMAEFEKRTKEPDLDAFELVSKAAS